MPTEEVFIAVKGPWQVFWLEGDTGARRSISARATSSTCRPASTAASRSLSDRPDALLMALVGGPDAGKVDWNIRVGARRGSARDRAQSVDDDGNLIIEKPAA